MTASWLRQSTYSTARFGLNNYFVGIARARTGRQQLGSTLEIVCSGLSGGLAGLIGNPSEVLFSAANRLRIVNLTRKQVALVRMCADRAKEPAERYGYRNAIDAMIKIYRNEGLSTFSRGLTPNIVRSVIMSKSSVKRSNHATTDSFRCVSNSNVRPRCNFTANLSQTLTAR